jgi:hypothetical protein
MKVFIIVLFILSCAQKSTTVRKSPTDHDVEKISGRKVPPKNNIGESSDEEEQLPKKEEIIRMLLSPDYSNFPPGSFQIPAEEDLAKMDPRELAELLETAKWYKVS